MATLGNKKTREITGGIETHKNITFYDSVILVFKCVYCVRLSIACTSHANCDRVYVVFSVFKKTPSNGISMSSFNVIFLA